MLLLLLLLLWLKLFDLELPHILKMIKIKTVIIFIQSVWVTRRTRSHLGAIRTVLDQLLELDTNFSVLRSIWDRMKINWSVWEPYFVLWISWSPNIAHKWFCIQNLSIDLSFQEKKRFKNPILGCQDIDKNKLDMSSAKFWVVGWVGGLPGGWIRWK